MYYNKMFGFNLKCLFMLCPGVLFFLFSTGCDVIGGGASKHQGALDSVQIISTEDLFTIRYRPKWTHQAQFAGAYMAKEKGFYIKHGLNVIIQPGGPDYPAYQSIINGNSDITTLFFIQALTKNDQGTPLVNLAQIGQKNTVLLVGRKNHSLTKFGDLHGTRIGVWRSDNPLAQLFLEDKMPDVEIVPVDWPVNLMLNNAVDVINVMRFSQYYRILMSGIEEDELFQIDLADYGYDFVDEGLYTSKEFYDEHSEECNKFADATMEGWIYALNNLDETINVVISYMRASHLPANRSQQAWMLSCMKDIIFHNPDAVGYLAKNEFDRVQTLLLNHNWISTKTDYDVFYPHKIKKQK